MHDIYRLGASLYAPANMPALADILSGRKVSHASSLIACTEDAVSEAELPDALARLRQALKLLPPRSNGPLRFVRPRNAEVLGEILAMPGVENLHGLVLPKVDSSSFAAYEKLLAGTRLWLMPTLETAQVLDVMGQHELRKCLQASALRDNILALRIGGNDLLRLLEMKRQRGVTIYETPIGLLVQQLQLGFRPHGFHLCAPVYDYFDDSETLAREAECDARMGLVGKTAIHPRQIHVIEKAFSVDENDLRVARRILSSDAAVFKLDGAMLESTVHAAWAQAVIERSRAQSGDEPPLACASGE